MITIIPINEEQTLLNSLSTVNTNSLRIDNETARIKEKISKWQSIYDFFINFNSLLKSNTTFSQTNSSIFINTATLVEANSSTWLKPISIFYPSIFPEVVTQDAIKSTILSWITDRFPLFTKQQDVYDSNYVYKDITPSTVNIDLTSPIAESPTYVDGQTLIVYAHRWKYGTSILESQILFDSTVCSTQDATICAHCVTKYYGYVYCSNGNFSCNGNSTTCQSCKTITCSFKTPPYYNSVFIPGINNQTLTHTSNTQSSQSAGSVKIITDGSIVYDTVTFFKQSIEKIKKWVGSPTTPILNSSLKSVYGQIVANVEMSFLDRNENSTITTMMFKVENCKWVFKKFL